MYSRVRRKARPVTRCRTSQVRLCRLFSDQSLILGLQVDLVRLAVTTIHLLDIAGGAKSPLESQNCTRFLNRPISTVLTPPLTIGHCLICRSGSQTPRTTWWMTDYATRRCGCS